MRRLSPGRAYAAILRHEFLGSLKGPLPWVGLVCLLALPLPVRMAYGGDIVILGRPVGETYRLAVALAGGYSLLAFFSTLYALCLCLERSGFHYLRHDDVLVLSRAVGRLPFYAAKVSAAFCNAALYGLLGLAWLWLELARIGASGTGRLLPLLLPLGLTWACLIAVYFALRNGMRSFLIFFLWLLALPLFFFTGLWHCYADPLKGGLRLVLYFPQLGSLHAWALGAVHPALQRPESSWALLNVGLWAALAFAAGAWVFLRKRL